MNEPKLRFKADDGSQFPDWEECTINDIFKFFNGKAHENIICEDGKHIVVNSKFISTDGMVKKYTDKMIFPLKKNDIVMVMSDVPNGKAMSKCFLIDKDDKYTLNQRICCLRTKENSIFFINQISRNKYFLKFDDGIKQTNLRKNDVLSCPVFRPCLAEQQKIAEFLSTIDTVIEKQKETVSAWEERKKGVMQKLFSQEVRFKADDGSDFPDWEEKKLSEIASIHARIGWQNLRKDEFLTDGNYLLITGTDFCNGRVNFSTCYYVDKERYEQDKNIQVENGTILVTKDGTLGKVALVENLNKPATLNAGVFAVKVIHADTISKFLYHWLAAPMLLEYASKKSTGGTIKHLNQGILVDFPVGVPCLEEQQKIADCLSSLDEVIEKQKATLAAWEELKKGLLQQMFV